MMVRFAMTCTLAFASSLGALAGASLADESAKVTEYDVVLWLYARHLTTPEKVSQGDIHLTVEALAIKYVLDSDLNFDVNRLTQEGRSKSIAQMAAKKLHVVFLDALSAEHPLELASEAPGESCTLFHLTVLAAPSPGWLRRIVERQEGKFEIVSEPGRDLERSLKYNPFLTELERQELRELLRSWDESGKIREIRSP